MKLLFVCISIFCSLRPLNSFENCLEFNKILDSRHQKVLKTDFSTINKSVDVLLCMREHKPLKETYKCCNKSSILRISAYGISELNYTWDFLNTHIQQSFYEDATFLRKFLVDNLRTTMQNLHTLFSSSYGYNYERNKDFFVNFFRNLEDYMLGKRQNLSLMVDDFFNELLSRVLRIMLFVKTERDQLVADCISSHLKLTNPFDRTPEIIKNMTLWAFPSVRILANALVLGHEILHAVSAEVKSSHICWEEFIRLRYCNLCFDIIEPTICPQNCLERLFSCSQVWLSLDMNWSLFIEQIIRITTRLEDSRSFPQVNRPLQIHISDAIMNLQTAFTRLEQSEDVLTNCTLRSTPNILPSLNRSVKRRSINNYQKINNNNVDNNNPHFYQIDNNGNLKFWSKSLRLRYSKYRNHFSELLHKICNPEFLRNNSHTHCWNGVDFVQKSHYYPVKINKNLNLISSHQSSIISWSLNRLKIITNMLQSIMERNADPNYLSTSLSNQFSEKSLFDLIENNRSVMNKTIRKGLNSKMHNNNNQVNLINQSKISNTNFLKSNKSNFNHNYLLESMKYTNAQSEKQKKQSNPLSYLTSFLNRKNEEDSSDEENGSGESSLDWLNVIDSTATNTNLFPDKTFSGEFRPRIDKISQIQSPINQNQPYELYSVSQPNQNKDKVDEYDGYDENVIENRIEKLNYDKQHSYTDIIYYHNPPEKIWIPNLKELSYRQQSQGHYFLPKYRYRPIKWIENTNSINNKFYLTSLITWNLIIAILFPSILC